MVRFVLFINFPFFGLPPGQDVINGDHSNRSKTFESTVDVAGSVSLTISNGVDSVIVGFDNLEKFFQRDQGDGTIVIVGVGSK